MRCVGVDLGTTNTAVALDGHILAQRDGNDSGATMPSVVAYPPSGAQLVGPAARKRRAIDPKNTVASSKRLMGQKLVAYAAQRYREQHACELVDQGGRAAFKTRAGIFSPTDVAAKILSRALSAAPPADAARQTVIAVPASFQEDAIAATVAAGRQIGLENLRTIAEPVATAVAYLTTFDTHERVVAVYDLGGGTFDFALLDCSDRAPRVIANVGDAYLGGDDADHAICTYVAREVMRRFSCDLMADALVRDRLALQCERAKIRLGFVDRARVDLAQVDPGVPCAGESITLDRDTVAQLAHELVGRTFGICDDALRAAGLRRQDVGSVFLSGGSTLLTCVRDGVTRYFGKLPRCDYDPMEVVAIGASLSCE